MPTVKLSADNKAVFRTGRVSCNCCGDPNLGCQPVARTTENFVSYNFAQGWFAGGTISIQCDLTFSCSLGFTNSFGQVITQDTSGSSTTVHTYTKGAGCEINNIQPSGLRFAAAPSGTSGTWNRLIDGVSSPINVGVSTQLNAQMRLYRDIETRRHFMFWRVISVAQHSGILARISGAGAFMRMTGIDNESFAQIGETRSSGVALILTGLRDAGGDDVPTPIFSGSGTINAFFTFTPSAP